MRYNIIKKSDIANGPGVRVSIFVQGCHFHCEGCFNSSTWDFEKGKAFTEDTLNTILELSNKNHIKGLSILGGEPLDPKNIDDVIKLSKEFKSKYPNKTIWLWTGYTIDKICNKDILNYIDVLVDGQFDIKLKNITLKYKGSENQRVIDVKKSIKENKIILLDN